MIIQCKECGTKYEFDKSQIEGEGVWVRCSHCEATFFQKNPLAEISSLMHLMEPEREDQREVTEENASALGAVETGDAVPGPTWEDAYQDVGEDIVIERAEEEEDRIAEGTEAGDAEQEPTWEDISLNAGDDIETEGVAEDAGDGHKVLGEIEVESRGPEATGEDVHPDVGEDIVIKRAEEEEEARVAEGTEGGDAEKVPTWEDVSLDAGDDIEIEGVAEDAGDGHKVLGEIEVESREPEPTGEDVYPDISDDIEIERVEEEEEARVAERAEAVDSGQEPTWEETYGDVDEITGGEETRERQRVREPWAFGDPDEGIYNERITGEKRVWGLWTFIKKAVLCLVLLALLSGGVYLWLVPEAREMILNRVSPLVEKVLKIKDSRGIEGIKKTVLPKVEKMLEIKGKSLPDKGLPELKVTMVNVAERFVKGWTAENIMVVEGSAVNANTIAVSNIRVRGKILDSSGNILSEEESNCGAILTDNELKSLTSDEIKKELSNPYGRDFRNADIRPGDGIPFMLVFTMPAEEASELVVELISIEAAKRE